MKFLGVVLSSRKIAWIPLVTLGVFLAACATQPVFTEENEPTESESEVLPSASPSSSPITAVSPSPKPTELVITRLCSPLFEHDLARIQDYVSNPFAEPVTSNLEMGHHGVDFSYFSKDGVGPPIDGTPLQAVMTGRVAGLGFDRLPYGNMIVIETAFERLPSQIISQYDMSVGSSLYLLYAHMLEGPEFTFGQEIECGQVIGHVGGSGFSGNPHLHLETRVGPSGLTLPPMVFYDTTATLEEQTAYQKWRFAGDFILFDPMILLSNSAIPNGEGSND